MNLSDNINNDLKKALKEKDEIKVSVLRQIKAAVKNGEIKKGQDFKDGDIEKTIFSLVKSHNESIAGFKKGGREDLVEREEKEREVLKRYLPEELSETEMKKIAGDAIKETGALSMKDMGKAMSCAMEKAKGRADGAKISAMVKEILQKG